MLIWNIITSLVFTMLIVLSVLGTGGWIGRFSSKLGGSTSSYDDVGTEVNLVLALGVFCQNVLILGLLGLYRSWVLIPFLLFSIFGIRHSRFNFKIKGPVWWLVFPGLYFLARFVSVSIPHQHSDPLYYHVYAAKFWASLGAIRLESAHPSFAQATFIEPLYGIYHATFGRIAATHSLFHDISGLLTAQQIHLWLGHALVVLLGARVIAQIRGSSVNTRDLFFAWLASVPYFFEWSSAVAKTDYFLALFTLATFAALLSKSWFLVGLFLGFAYATKVFAFWTLIALPIVLPPRHWHRAAVGFLCGMGPVLLRNLVFLKNPMFPALDSVLGPGWISQKWAQSNAGFAGPPAWPTSFHWYQKQVFAKPISVLMLAVFVLAPLLFVRVKVRAYARWWLFLFAQIVVGVLILKPTAEGRYFGPVAICAALFGFAIILERVKSKKAWTFALCGLGLMVNIPVDVFYKIPTRYWFAARERYLQQYLPVYEWQAWVNQNLGSDARLVSLNEKQNYYLKGFLENTVEMKSWEELINKNKDSARTLAKEVAALGFTHLHYYPSQSRFTPWYELPKDLESLARDCVLCTKDSVIVDLTVFQSQR